MKESELNTILKNNFMRDGWGHKFPDPSKQNIVGSSNGRAVFNHRPNPFDGVGINPNFIIFYETKLLKDYQAFSFSRIEDHQIENLMRINQAMDRNFLQEYCSLWADHIYPLIICGVYQERIGVDLFFFSVKFIDEQMKKGIKSVNKKQLLQYKEKNIYLPIRKKEFNVNRVPGVIINGEIV